MPYNYQIIFLSLFIFNSSLAIENPPLNIKPLEKQNIPETICDILNNQQHHHHHEHHHHHYPQQQQVAQTIAQSLVFSEIDIEEMNLVFRTSPQEAQFIIKYLQNPKLFEFTQDYRSATFVGEPGTGKTTTAKAIAYEMSKQGWECKFLSSTSLLGEYRNQTSIQLQKEFEVIETSKKPTILIIDELNRLLENSNSKHHDTDTIATALWTFLDKHRDNKNFFFIGTMNRANKLPKAYKNRILIDYIEFPLVSNPKFKIEFIRRDLTTKNTQLDTEITDIFLDKELEKMGICAPRDLKNLSNGIYKRSIMTQPTPAHGKMIIKKATITDVINQYVQNKSKLDYDVEEETDEERQNRHHKENINMHETHFAQQQLIQIILSYENNPLISIRDSLHGRENYTTSLLTDEQLKFCKNITANTQARKA